jgi:hypothetical protein
MTDPTKFMTTCARNCEARSYQITVRQQAAKIADLESKVDELMLEHCPTEMTQDQLDNWVKSQKIVKPTGE